VHNLEDYGFRLAKKGPHSMSTFWRQLVGLACWQVHPLNSHVHPTKQCGKDVCQFVPSIDHANKWQIASLMNVMVRLWRFSPLGYGKIFSLTMGVLNNSNEY
jgi:hypothetical protein